VGKEFYYRVDQLAENVTLKNELYCYTEYNTRLSDEIRINTLTLSNLRHQTD